MVILNLASSQRDAVDVALFLRDLDGGGAERAIIALAGEIAERGYAVDLVVGDAASDFRSEVSSQVNVVDFATRSPLRLFSRLIAYLRRRKPAAVMSALDIANILLLIAARVAGYKGRTVVSQRAVVAASQCDLALGRRMLTKFLQRVCFPRADALISNSHAAASDLQTLLRVPANKITTIHNALDADRIKRLAGEQIEDGFFLNDRTPLIVSVGSLTKRKDVGTLIRAFAIVKARTPARLVIVGKGVEQPRIECLIAELGLSESVLLPGFDSNPYKWMAAAAVCVSSSTGEGFPNVVAEALTLGRPVVATDCPGDTAELLAYGQWGRLVPVGDPQAMANAILAALHDSTPADGRLRAADFSPASIVSAYLNVLLPKTT